MRGALLFCGVVNVCVFVGWLGRVLGILCGGLLRGKKEGRRDVRDKSKP